MGTWFVVGPDNKTAYLFDQEPERIEEVCSSGDIIQYWGVDIGGHYKTAIVHGLPVPLSAFATNYQDRTWEDSPVEI